MPDRETLRKLLATVQREIDELEHKLGKIKANDRRQAEWRKRRITLTKKLYDRLELRWALRLARDAPTSDVLIHAEVMGIRRPLTTKGGVTQNPFISTDVMTKRGLMPIRTYDVLQYDKVHPAVQPHELKSKSVLPSSVKGGSKSGGDMVAVLRVDSRPERQIWIERKVITEALKVPGSKIVIRGVDPLTGRLVKLEIDPRDLNISRFHDYRSAPSSYKITKPEHTATVVTPDDEKKRKEELREKDETRKKREAKKKWDAKARDEKSVKNPADTPGKDRTNAPRKTKAAPKLDRGVTPPSPNSPGADDAGKEPAQKKRSPRKTAPDVGTKATDDRRVDRSANAKGRRADTPKKPVAPVKAPDVAAVKVKPETPATPPPTPAQPKDIAPPTKAVHAPSKPGSGTFRLNLEIHPKVKATGGFILSIGFSLLAGWGESKAVARTIEDAVKANADKFTDLLNTGYVLDDFARFRRGKSMELGYQLYFRIELAVGRRCTDGGCGHSGVLTRIRFTQVTFSRIKGKDFVPEAEREKGWRGSDATAVLFQPIFGLGLPISRGIEDAADGRLELFEHLFVRREAKALGDWEIEYFDDFKQYCALFPESDAGKLFQRFTQNKYLVDINDVDFARKKPIRLMEQPHNLEFEAVLKAVRWGRTARIWFIRDYYDVVIHLPGQYAIPLLDKYDFWFRQLDDAERACQSSCHRMIGSRSTFQRVTADELRQKLRSPLYRGTESRGLSTLPMSH